MSITTIAKQAAFVLAVFAVAKIVNNTVSIPVVGQYLPK
jgi:hypothetical protein